MTLFDINGNIDTLLVVSQKNRRYFTGFDSTFGYLVLTKERRIFLTDYRYFEMAQDIKSDFELTAVGRYDLEDLLKKTLKDVGAVNIGFEDTELTVSEYSALKEMLDGFNLVPVGKDLAEMKKYKTEYELECIATAQKITDAAFSDVLAHIKEGMTEKELSVILQCCLLENGGEKNSFDPIVSFGENTSKPHAHPTDRALSFGDNILMDFGCVYKGYCSDMTRTVFFGNPNEKMADIYSIVLKAQTAALGGMKSGMKACEVDALARSVFSQNGVEDKFTHALGHGVGIDIHEIPSMHPKNDTVLKENMVVTVEPGLYFPGLGGVRIEDLTVIKQDGVNNLTTSDKNIIIIR